MTVSGLAWNEWCKLTVLIGDESDTRRIRSIDLHDTRTRNRRQRNGADLWRRFGFLYSAQCKWRNANYPHPNPDPNPNPNPKSYPNLKLFNE